MTKFFPRLGAPFERTLGDGSSHALVDGACPRCAALAVHYEGSEPLDDSDPDLPVYTAIRDWFRCTGCTKHWSEDRTL